MKFQLTLIALLTVAGLSQARNFPDFGKGPLHEDIQDILDLVPIDEIKDVFEEYAKKDNEVKSIIEIAESTSIVKNLVEDFEAIPEAINFFNYLHKKKVYIYDVMNALNKRLGIKKELVPPSVLVREPYTNPMRTGGLAGLFKDIKVLFNYDDFIRIYVQKSKTSKSFSKFIDQLKSKNFQELVNQVYEIKSFQLILYTLHDAGVDTRIVSDIMYIVLGITTPNYPDFF